MGEYGDHQEDAYAVRRAELDRQFQALPRPGTSDYWQQIEHAPAEHALPLEVLARCLRERQRAGDRGDADRVFAVILGRIQQPTQVWARKVAGMARLQDRHALAEDLEQRCYITVWEELVQDEPTFLLEASMHTLRRIQQHVAHMEMEQVGEWKRRGVTTPTRVPSGELQRLELGAAVGAGAGTDNGETPAVMDIQDPRAAAAFEDVEQTSDVYALLSTLNADDRLLIYDAFYRDLPQQQIAERLQVSDRTVRNRLTRTVQWLRAHYLAGEESADHG